ncbi:MAG: RNA-guided endonuclease InsQ/TnpB family protein [Ktedonobacteraceae bacterium]
MKHKRAYKYRFYPTEEQKHMLARTFGCARYVYNWALRLRTDAYYQRQQRIGYHETSAALTELKKQESHTWLNDVSSVPPQQALRHLDRAFRNFFEGRTEYPKFHKKHDVQSAEYTTSAFKWDGKHLTLARMDTPLDIHWSRPLPKGCKPTTVTVTKDCANRYFVSILVEEDIKYLPVVNKQVGLDLGLTSMVIASDGHTYGNPKFFAKDEKKLAQAQRRHAKKKKGGKNRRKAQFKVAHIHARIADRRKDYQHKLSTQIIRENQVVCVESLQVKNMVQNHKLAKAISDVGWGEFVRQLEYKAEWYGRTLVKIDKFYPSSKRCFDCGHILDSLTLDIRFWICPQCGVSHDRDINAARNILAAGLAVAACGEMVRPGRAEARTGTSH